MKLTQVNIMILFLTLKASFVDLLIDHDDFYPQIFIFPKDRKGSKRRILGGSAAPSRGYPFVVALLDQNKKEHCTGSIIAPTFVLTAAHCSGAKFVYKALEDNRSQDGKYYTVKAIIPHPSYQLKLEKVGSETTIGEIHNDIGLVQTSENIIQGWVSQISLSQASAANVEHQSAMAIGFGLMNMFTYSGLSNLQHAQLELVQCPVTTWTITVCAITPKSVPTTRAICSGDSGGPLVHRGKLLGVNSLGPALCSEFLPRESSLSAFTLVSAYIPWIQGKIGTKQANADSNLIALTMSTPKFGARVSKSIKYSESEKLINTNYEEKIIMQDIYYTGRSDTNSASFFLINSVLLRPILFCFLCLIL